jgi:hypothetical protein
VAKFSPPRQAATTTGRLRSCPRGWHANAGRLEEWQRARVKDKGKRMNAALILEPLDFVLSLVLYHLPFNLYSLSFTL